MKKRGLTGLVFVAFLAVFGLASIQAEAADYHLTIDGHETHAEQVPIYRNGSVLVPLRLIFESLHATVTYISAEQKIVGEKGNLTIELEIGSSTAYKNKQPISLPQPPFLLDDHVYVPVRFIGEALGAKVEWIEETRTVQIWTALERTVLPVVNDGGQPVVLEHRGNMKLKWSMQDQSPYQRYEGFVDADGTLIFLGFDEIIRTDRDGKIRSRAPFEKQESLGMNAIARDGGYDLSPIRSGMTDEGDKPVWKGIPLYTKSNVFPVVVIDGKPSMDYLYSTAIRDRAGNLIVLTDDGLASYDPEGKRLWVHDEWSDGAESVSAFGEIGGIRTDAANRLYISYSDDLVVLDETGETVALVPGWFEPDVLDDGAMLDYGSVYRITDGELQSAWDLPDVPWQSFRYPDDEHSLQRIDPATGEVLWTYDMDHAEAVRGYSLFPGTLTTDASGNIYISTTGGTVHGLDAQGKVRFNLTIDDGAISSAQVIPISADEIVVVDNNAVMCFVVDGAAE